MQSSTSGSPSPAALQQVLAAAGGALNDMARGNLPRLHALCGELRREAGVADAEPLLAAFEEHLAAGQALRFELLIPPGLRAVPSRADEAAFRVQVQRLVAATGRTWSELRTYLGASAGAAARGDVLLSEFVMQARSLQRGTVHWDGMLAQVARELREGPPHEHLDGILRRLQHLSASFNRACTGAREVRRLVHDMEQQRAGVHLALQQLAHAMGGGLLERLRPMVAGNSNTSRDDIGAAQAAWQVLQPLLAAAVAYLHRMDAARAQLLAQLDDLGELARPSAWTNTGSAPLAAEA